MRRLLQRVPASCEVISSGKMIVQPVRKLCPSLASLSPLLAGGPCSLLSRRSRVRWGVVGRGGSGRCGAGFRARRAARLFVTRQRLLPAQSKACFAGGLLDYLDRNHHEVVVLLLVGAEGHPSQDCEVGGSPTRSAPQQRNPLICGSHRTSSP